MAEKFKFDRGTALTIFKSDRSEDLVALVIAAVLVLLVVMSVPR